MRRLLLLLFVVPALAVAASSGSAATSTTVSITAKGFNPSTVLVAAGDSVAWTNNDTLRHQVVSNTGAFSSPILASKQTYGHTFRTGGTFAYHDGLHPSLHGTVTVIPQRTVWITSDGFRPTTLAIRTGQSVTWVNKTTANQQVTADDASFASPVLAAGARFTHTFAAAGTIGYHDALQPTMKGTVVVTSPAPGESISLDSNKTVVTYGNSVVLNGSVTNGTAGENVTITAHPQGVKAAQSVQSTTTGADGSFSATVQPLSHTVYVASTGKSTSDPLAVNVRPLIRFRRIGRSTELVHVIAARSFFHRYVFVQRWRSRPGVWSSIARVRLTSVHTGVSPTVTTSRTFRLRIRHGLRLRVRMTLSQTVPGYISGVSNAIRS
jgi:plastocyanin